VPLSFNDEANYEGAFVLQSHLSTTQGDSPCYVDFCHHGKARRIADGGDGLQIWRVIVNTMNKQSRTAEKG
jgi:hypothetical protein